MRVYACVSVRVCVCVMLILCRVAWLLLPFDRSIGTAGGSRVCAGVVSGCTDEDVRLNEDQCDESDGAWCC